MICFPHQPLPTSTVLPFFYYLVRKLPIVVKKKSIKIYLVEINDNNCDLFAPPAITHLDRVTLWGKTLRVNSSKHSTVQLPKEGQPDAGLTKDYYNSTLHRFKKPGSKNYQVRMWIFVSTYINLFFFFLN